MPTVYKSEEFVTVAYTLACGHMRAEALARDLERVLREDKGFEDAQDKTIVMQGDRQATVEVTYASLKGANRLDPEVRRLLSRKVKFSFGFTDDPYARPATEVFS